MLRLLQPFTIILPTQCVAPNVDPFKEQVGPFNTQHGQPLPPSFADTHSSFSGGWDGECFVRYEVEATLIGDQSRIFSSGTETSTRVLDFVTSRSIQFPDSKLTLGSRTIACHSLRLQPDNEGLPLTFKEKLQFMRTSKLQWRCS